MGPKKNSRMLSKVFLAIALIALGLISVLSLSSSSQNALVRRSLLQVEPRDGKAQAMEGEGEEGQGGEEAGVEGGQEGDEEGDEEVKEESPHGEKSKSIEQEESASEESVSDGEVPSLSADSDPSISSDGDASEELSSSEGKSDGLTTDSAGGKSEKQKEFDSKAQGKQGVRGVRAVLNQAAAKGDIESLVKALKVYAQKKGIEITVTINMDSSVSVDVTKAADGSSVENDTKSISNLLAEYQVVEDIEPIGEGDATSAAALTLSAAALVAAIAAF